MTRFAAAIQGLHAPTGRREKSPRRQPLERDLESFNVRGGWHSLARPSLPRIGKAALTLALPPTFAAGTLSEAPTFPGEAGACGKCGSSGQKSARVMGWG